MNLYGSDIDCGPACCTSFKTCPAYKPKKALKRQIRDLKRQLKELKDK